MGVQTLSRRRVLKGAALGAAGAALAACGATPTPQVIEKAVTQVVEKEVTRVVEGTPQVIKETVVVESIVTATPAPAVKAHVIAVTTGDGKDLTEALKPFTDSHPNIEVEVIGVAWDGYDEKVDLLIASGDPPALWWGAAKRGFRYYADKGMFPDIGPLIERDNYPVDDFYKAAYDFLKWEGKQIGFPSTQKLSVIFYNKTLFDKAGVPVPPATWDDASWTWDAFLAAAQKLTVADKDPLKATWGTGGAFDTRHFAWIFGGDYFDEQGYATGKPDKTIVNSPEVIDGLQFMHDLIYKYHVQPTPAEGQIINSAGVDLFLSGKVGMLFNATWAFPTYGEIKDFEWGIAPVPGGKKVRKTLLWANAWNMFKDQKFPDAAWEVLKYMSSTDGMRSWMFKVPGNRGSAVPARSGLSDEWVTVAEQVTKLSANMLKDVIVTGIDKYGKITSSLAIVKFAEINDVAITPNLDNVFLDKTTPKEAVAAMEAKINEILAAK